MLTRHRLFACASALVLTTSLIAPMAHAGGKDFAIYTTRLGGDTETAQPYVDRFAAFLESSPEWNKSATGLKGRFLSSKKEVQTYIDTQKPGFGVLEPWLYFEMKKQHQLEAVAQVESSDLNASRLHVIVKDPAIKSLDDLKGKRLWTHLAESPQYLAQVALDGKVASVATQFQLKQVGNAMKAARAVLRGETDAAIVDDEQLAAAKKLEGGEALRSVFASSPQPPVSVVIFGGVTPAAVDKKVLAKSLISLCGTPKGAEICKEMHITKFVPLNAALFTAAEKRYESTGGAKK